MSGLTSDQILGLLRAAEENDPNPGAAMMERWGQDYREVVRVAVHASNAESFMVGVELGLRMSDALRELDEIKEGTHVES